MGYSYQLILIYIIGSSLFKNTINAKDYRPSAARDRDGGAKKVHGRSFGELHRRQTETTNEKDRNNLILAALYGGLGQGISTTTFDYANGLNPDIEKAGGYGIPPGIYSYAFDPKTGLPFVCDPTKTPTGGSPQMAEGGGAVNNPTVTKAVADSKMNDLQSKNRASNGISTAMNANKEDVQRTSKQRVSVMIPISMIENTTKNHRNSMVDDKAIRSSLNDGHHLTSLYNKLTSTSRQRSEFFESGPTSHESTRLHSFKKPLFVKLFSNQPKEDKQQTRVKLHKHMDESTKKTTGRKQTSGRKHTNKKIMSTKPYTKDYGIILNDRYRTNTPDLESGEEIEEPGDENQTPLTENFHVQSKKKSGDIKKIKPKKGFRKSIQSSTWSRKNGITIKLPDIPACPDMKNYHWPWNCLEKDGTAGKKNCILKTLRTQRKHNKRN